MKKIVLAAVAVAVAVMATPVLAENVITTGSSSGTYYKVGNNLRSFVPDAKVLKSKGSVQNLDRLMNGEANIAVVQMDAYAWYINKHPEAAADLEILGSIYKECSYLAVRCDGKVKDEDDLQKVKGATIAVGKQGSGTAVTWDYMIQLEPKYKNASVVFAGGSRALGKLAAKQVDAVMWVERPRMDGKVATVMKNKELCLEGFNDMDLNDKLASTGKPVYEFEEVEVAKGFFNDKEFKTACVEAIIIARTDTDEDVLDKIADVLLNYKSSLLK